MESRPGDAGGQAAGSPGGAAAGYCPSRLAKMMAEVPVEDLRYKMIMALNAADIGNPPCEQAAGIGAEIAEQYCARLHVITTAQVIANWPARSQRPHARACLNRALTAGPQERRRHKRQARAITG